MKRLAFGLALAALGLLAGPVRAADSPALPAYKPSWMKRNFGIGPEPPKPPPPIKRDPAVEASNARATAEADLFRRQTVCDALRQVAFDANKPELHDQANELDQKAWDIYLRQTAHLPCNRLVPADVEKAMGSRLIGPGGTTTAADHLEATRGSDTGRRAQASAIREIKP